MYYHSDSHHALHCGGGTVLKSINFSGTLEKIKRPKRTLKSQQSLTTITTQCDHVSQCLWKHTSKRKQSILLPNPQHYQTLGREPCSAPTTFSLIIHRPRLHVLSKHTILSGAGLTMHYASYLLFDTFCSRLDIQFQDLLSFRFWDLSLKCRTLSWSKLSSYKFVKIWLTHL